MKIAKILITLQIILVLFSANVFGVVTRTLSSGKKGFYQQQYNDNKKRRYCALNGIKLVEIPYTEENLISYDYIMDASRAEVKIKEIFQMNDVDFTQEYVIPGLNSSNGRPLRFETGSL